MTPQQLLAACDAVVAAPDLLPEYTVQGDLVRTWCNVGAQRVAQAVGCPDLDLPNVEENADFLAGLLSKSSRWVRLDGTQAVLHALGHPGGQWGGCKPNCQGGLAYAVLTGAQLAERHGHIATVRPEPLRDSSSGKVPMLANVGRGCPTIPLRPLKPGVLTRPNWNCRASEAYPIKRVGHPSYYAWRP